MVTMSNIIEYIYIYNPINTTLIIINLYIYIIYILYDYMIP